MGPADLNGALPLPQWVLRLHVHVMCTHVLQRALTPKALPSRTAVHVAGRRRRPVRELRYAPLARVRQPVTTPVEARWVATPQPWVI